MTEPARPEAVGAAPAVPIDGSWDPRFEAVRAAFEANFADPAEPEQGGAVCVRLSGRTVVDVWGGHVDEARRLPWRRDTLVNVYSMGKGILAILALACVEEGLLDLDAAVASVWPELGVRGKDRLTLRGLLGHRAGLPALRTALPEGAQYDWKGICTELAAQEPWWEPGAHHGYHPNTHGHLVGEVLARVTGTPVGELLRRRLCDPLEADLHWGLPEPEHVRVSPVFFLPHLRAPPERLAAGMPTTGDAARDAMIRAAYFNPPGFSGFGCVNTAEWRRAVIPSTNGHGTARAVAVLYDAHLHGGVVDGASRVRVAGSGLRREAAQTVSEGHDRVLDRPSRFGLGFQLPQPSRPIGPNPGAYGHFGYGGSLGFADPEADVAFAYVTNRPGERWKGARASRLVEAVYACL